MTPNLFINGLRYDEPELKNYYDKNEMSIITNSLKEMIDLNSLTGKEFCRELIKIINEDSD